MGQEAASQMSLVRRYMLTIAACAFLPFVQGGATADAFSDAVELFERGDLVGARDRWMDQLAKQPSAALYYNLGRVDQELGAGPQAVLWYRRALARAPEDPWALENLERLRRDLGLPEPNRQDPLALLHVALPWSTWFVAAGLWLVLGLRWGVGKPRGWMLAATAGVLVAGYLGLHVTARLGPVEAVLMSECQADGASLPAGSEVWESRSTPGRVWVTGERFDCRSDSLFTVDSNQIPPPPATLDSPIPEPVNTEPVADIEANPPSTESTTTS